VTSDPSTSDLLRQLLSALRRQWRPAALVGLAVIGVTIAAYLVLPRKYQSEALLFVKVGASSVTLDPTATTGPTISLYESRETEINSILQILTSRAMLERTVETLGPEVVLGEKPLSARVEVDDENRPSVSDGPTESQFDERGQQAIRALADSVYISTPKKSTVISVGSAAPSPEVAQRIVETILAQFQEEHLRVNATRGSYAFFENQTEELAARIAETSDALIQKKNDAGVLLLDEQRKNVEKQLSDLTDRLRVAQSEVVGSTASIAALEDALAFLPDRVETERTIGISNDAYDRMRDRLYELEIRERDLRARYTDTHPTVQAVLEQVREAEALVSKQAPERTQIREIVPPSRVKAEEELVGERARLASLTSLVEKLESQQGELLTGLRQMNDEETEIARLEREKAVLEATYRLAAEKLEQARIQKALAEERVSNVNVIQPASYDPKPVSPKASMVLGAGFLLAMLSFVATAWLLDRFDDSVRSAGDLERRLQAPSLGRLPRSATGELSWN
jgi:uncharacterized protein involved in exopolysaccharide biosynthesis